MEVKASSKGQLEKKSTLNYISKEKENIIYHFLFDFFFFKYYILKHLQLTTINTDRYLLSTTTPIENQRILIPLQYQTKKVQNMANSKLVLEMLVELLKKTNTK